jgi:hypothetical protein
MPDLHERSAAVSAADAMTVDPNLEMDTAVLASMQKFAADLGYLKYKDPLPVENCSTSRTATARSRSWGGSSAGERMDGRRREDGGFRDHGPLFSLDGGPRKGPPTADKPLAQGGRRCTGGYR